MHPPFSRLFSGFPAPDSELYKPPSIALICPPSTELLGPKPFILTCIEAFADTELFVDDGKGLKMSSRRKMKLLFSLEDLPNLSETASVSRIRRRIQTLNNEPKIRRARLKKSLMAVVSKSTAVPDEALENGDSPSLSRMLAALGAACRKRICEIYELPVPETILEALRKLEGQSLGDLSWEKPGGRGVDSSVADITPIAALLEKSDRANGNRISLSSIDIRGLNRHSLRLQKRRLVELGFLDDTGSITNAGRDAAARNRIFVAQWAGVAGF